MEDHGTCFIWATLYLGDRGGGESFRDHLQPLFRIPLRVYALLVAIAYDVHDLLLLGGTRGFIFIVDLLASGFRAFVNDQKPEMGVSCDDGFCAGSDVFDFDDFRGDYPLDRFESGFFAFLVVARSAAGSTDLEHAA